MTQLGIRYLLGAMPLGRVLSAIVATRGPSQPVKRCLMYVCSYTLSTYMSLGPLRNSRLGPGKGKSEPKELTSNRNATGIIIGLFVDNFRCENGATQLSIHSLKFCTQAFANKINISCHTYPNVASIFVYCRMWYINKVNGICADAQF